MGIQVKRLRQRDTWKEEIKSFDSRFNRSGGGGGPTIMMVELLSKGIH